MAESKVDYSQLIGFLFLMAAFVSFLFISPPSEDEIDIQSEENVAINDSFNVNQDSRANEAEFSENIVKIEEESFIVENENVILKFSNMGAKISELTLKEAAILVDQKIVSGGMIPKLQTCISTVNSGAEAAVILDGRLPHALLIEIIDIKYKRKHLID